MRTCRRMGWMLALGLVTGAAGCWCSRAPEGSPPAAAGGAPQVGAAAGAQTPAGSAEAPSGLEASGPATGGAATVVVAPPGVVVSRPAELVKGKVYQLSSPPLPSIPSLVKGGLAPPPPPERKMTEEEQKQYDATHVEANRLPRSKSKSKTH